MSAAFDTCREHHISLDRYSVGEYRTTCPQCSHHRKAIHRKVKCLAVSITFEMILWHCHHCGWEGGSRKPDAQSVPRRSIKPQQSLRSMYR